MYNRLFLDSGAFSADKSGNPINLTEYIKFIHENKDQIEVYANLDVIGDWEATWENQKIMEAEGLKPLPVHHLEDPMKCLDWCLEYDYFALGGIAGGASMKDRIRFFDKCWDVICDEEGTPNSKVHGFGMASPQLVYQYPWYSIDSSSWVAYGRYGIVIMPRVKDEYYDYFSPPVKIFVTDRSPKKSDDGLHYNNLSPNEQWQFDRFIEFHKLPFGIGLKDEKDFVPGVSNDNFWRDLMNYIFFASMCKMTKQYPWKWKRPNQLGNLF